MSKELNKAPVEQAEPASCQGTNCGTTTGDHSSECLAEAAASQGWELKPGDLCGRDCPMRPDPVEQAGGDERDLQGAQGERQAFEAHESRERRLSPADQKFWFRRGAVADYDIKSIDDAWKAWKARAALAQPALQCKKCGGTGDADSGGIHPWGEAAMVPCDCAHTERAQGKRTEDGDTIIDRLRLGGLTIDGDNAYKRDLLDCVVGALAFGFQGRPAPEETHWLHRFWEIGNAEREARAALAQPSPTLPPFAEKVLAKLRRFNECAEDSDSGGVDIGRHWLDLLTQLGLLNRVQRSPALWEISQQGEDLLGLDVPEIEVPDSMIEKAWQRFERTLQQLETPGQAEQAEQAEAERPEGPTEDELEAAGLGYPLHKEEAVKLWYSGFRSEVITVLEAWEAIGHDIGMNPDKGELLDSLRYMLEKCEAHDAALAEVAGLRSLLNSLLCYVERDIDRMRSDRDKSDNKEIYDRSISLAMERLKAAQNAVFTTEPGCDTAVELAAQTTQAQHCVPEGWVQSLPLKNHQPCKPNEDRANGYTIPIYSRPALVEEALRKLRAVLCDPIGNVVIDGSDSDREEVQQALGMLAAAPGKEVGHE
ncbi:hypothetical protein ACM7LX_33095 [Pseudomonas aeruginosa]